MTQRLLGPTGQRRKRLWLIGPLTAVAMLVGLFATSAAVAVDNANCVTLDTLPLSTFEIDKIAAPPAGSKKNTLPTAGANLKVDDSDCLDWLAVSRSRSRTG